VVCELSGRYDEDRLGQPGGMARRQSSQALASGGMAEQRGLLQVDRLHPCRQRVYQVLDGGLRRLLRPSETSADSLHTRDGWRSTMLPSAAGSGETLIVRG
jgi:hypothetical protein